MTPYVQREVFRAFEQVIFKRATRAVSYLDSSWGNELRCHELARAVHRLLDVATMRVVDGRLGAVEHSWLELAIPIARHEEGLHAYQERRERTATSIHFVDGRPTVRHTGYQRRVIIDVYVPGRLPQVQLIDPFPMLLTRYASGQPRTDIDEEIVERAWKQMRDAWIAETPRGETV